MCEAIIAVGGMQPGHRQQVLKDMAPAVRMNAAPVAPLLQRHIDIGDRPAEGFGVFRRHGPHVLDFGPVNS